LFTIHVADDFVVVYDYMMDALMEGAGIKITLEGIDFGEFGHGFFFDPKQVKGGIVRNI